MNADDPVISQAITCKLAKIEILIKLFLENVEIFHNCLKLPFFGLKIRLLFTDLFRIWFGSSFGSGFESGSEKFRILTDPDPQHCSNDCILCA
jgi:hypothetical protein